MHEREVFLVELKIKIIKKYKKIIVMDVQLKKKTRTKYLIIPLYMYIVFKRYKCKA